MTYIKNHFVTLIFTMVFALILLPILAFLFLIILQVIGKLIILYWPFKYNLTRSTKKYLKLKILGTGEIKKNIVISAHFASKQALTKIEKAGGKISIIKK